MMLSVDLGIIGSGSGNSLITPYWDDKRVALAEKGVFGGTCLNFGCIPTKMYVRPATLARGPEEAARVNVSQRTTGVDWPSMRDRIFSRVDAISEGGERYRRDELDNVELVSQTVRLLPVSEGLGWEADDGSQVRADRLVVAAGSRASLPEVPGIDLPGVHTSDTVMRIDDLPGRVLVLGGGYIACEFAGIFSGLGSRVTQVIRRNRLLRTSDADISDAFTAEAARQWELRTGLELEGIEQGDGGLRATFAPAAPGASPDRRETETIDADVILVAFGRRPNSDLVGADEAGIDLHDDGRIAVDEYQRVLAGGSPVPGLFALGDVCSPWQLKHVANYECRVVAHNLEHPDDLRAADMSPVPGAVFSSPEVAQAGLTEAQAVEKLGGDRISVKVQRYGDTAYGWAMEDRTGIFKVVGDRRDGKILGVHAMGYQASNLVQPVVMAMSFGIPAHEVARGQYWIHPAIMEVAENALLGIERD